MSPRPKLSQAVCAVGSRAPALAGQHRQGPKCSPGPAPRKRPVVFAGAKTSEPLDPYSLCLGQLCLPGLREAPLVQRGDSMAKPCKGGLTALNCLDDTSCQVWDLVAGCPQSLSRRSPTAPFAQGSRLCCSAYNRPPPVDNKKLPRWGSFFAFISVLSSSAGAQFGCPDTGPAQKKSLCPR